MPDPRSAARDRYDRRQPVRVRCAPFIDECQRAPYLAVFVHFLTPFTEHEATRARIGEWGDTEARR